MLVKILYARGSVEQKGLDGKLHSTPAPTGEGHIFKMVRNSKSGKMELSPYSMCGKGQWDTVGKNAMIREGAVVSLPICEECAAAWREDAASPWTKWARVQE